MNPSVAEIIHRSGVRFQLTKLGRSGYGLMPRKWVGKVPENHFIVKTVHTAFDKRFYSHPHTPILLGEVINEGKFSQPNGIRILDCPIKFPGSNYRLPREASQFDEVLTRMISLEHHINPNVDEYYAYLTIDQGHIKKGELQRRKGCHVDGFQGARIVNKQAINRSYIAYDCAPPKFYCQPFSVAHLSERYVNYFEEFDRQATIQGEVFFDPYSILLMNAYTVHKATPVNMDRYRTFVRLSYDVREYDRLGNTHNPLFDYKWEMVERSTQFDLVKRVAI